MLQRSLFGRRLCRGAVLVIVALAGLVPGSAAAAPISPVGSPVPTGADPDSVAYSPSGGLLAVANQTDGSISMYSVGASGALTSLGTPMATTVGGTMTRRFSPDGTRLAAADQSSSGSDVELFSVGGTGSLTRTGSAALPGGAGALSFSPDGHYLVAGAQTGMSGELDVLAVGSSGTLTEVGSPAPAGDDPSSAAFTSTGQSLVVADSGAQTVSVYDFSAGTLTAVGSPVSSVDPVGVAISPGGNLIAVSNYSANTVSTYTLSGSGVLSAVGSAATANGPLGVAFSPGGGLLAVSDSGADGISLYTTGANGTLSPLSGSPVATGTNTGPQDLQFDPAGGSLAVANSNTNTVSALAIAPPTIAITTPAAGAQYTQGSSVAAAFACTAGATALTACTGSTAAGMALDTATPGQHTFTVAARDADGTTAALSSTYVVSAAFVTAPTAALTTDAPPTAGEPAVLDASASAPGSGHIVSYDWSLNGGRTYTTSTGVNPRFIYSLTAGVHELGVRVASSTGQSATKEMTLDVPTAAQSGRSGCKSELDLGAAQLLADCIKPRAGGGYTITAADLDVNGMDLTTQDGNAATFTLTVDSRGDFLSGPVVGVILRNTPAGDLALGKINLASTPLDLSTPTAGAARAAATLPSNSLILTLTGNVGTRVVTLGVGHPCAPGADGSVSCCPKTSYAKLGKKELFPTVLCGKLPGNIPLAGTVTVFLGRGGELVIVANAALDETDLGFQVTGGVQITADLKTGIHLTGLEFGVPRAKLGPLDVTDALFQYYLPDYRDPKTGSTAMADSFNAAATISVAGAATDFKLSASLGFREGQFNHGSVFLQLPPGVGLPVFPGVTINAVGANIARTPALSFGGSIGASITQAFELTANFQYAAPTASDLGYFGLQGTLDFQGQRVATASGEVFSDGFFDADLGLDYHYPKDATSDGSADVVAAGNLSFWDDPRSGHFQGAGKLELTLFKYVSLDGEAQLSKGSASHPDDTVVAACGKALLFARPSGWFDITSADAHSGDLQEGRVTTSTSSTTSATRRCRSSRPPAAEALRKVHPDAHPVASRREQQLHPSPPGRRRGAQGERDRWDAEGRAHPSIGSAPCPCRPPKVRRPRPAVPRWRWPARQPMTPRFSSSTRAPAAGGSPGSGRPRAAAGPIRERIASACHSRSGTGRTGRPRSSQVPHRSLRAGDGRALR